MFSNYLKLTFRNLSKNKTFFIINITGLATGIAASLILFVIVKYELSYEKFQPNYKRIHHIVTGINFSNGMSYNPGISMPALDALRTGFPNISFAAINATYGSQVTVPVSSSAEAGKKFIEDKGIFFCEPQYFKVFTGYHWLIGSAAVLNEPNTVVLSKSTAEKYFGKWQSAIDKALMLDNTINLKVAGILQDVPANTDLPLMILISYKTFKANGSLYGYTNDWGSVSSNHQIYALLPQNVMVDAMDRQLVQFSKTHYKNDGQTKINFLQPLPQMHFDTRFELFGETVISKATLWTLSIIGAVIILMACINFINLSTAQAVNRSKEVGIRKVLGSNRAMLFRQLMAETAFVVLLALVIAAVMVTVAFPYIKHIASVEEKLTLFNAQTFGMIAVLAIVVTLLAGLYPSFVMSGFNPVTALKNKSAVTNARGISLRRGLVVTQFAISQVLIVATIVTISQMNFVRNADLGFNKEAVLVLTGSSDSVTVAKLPAFKQQLLGLPGVQSVSFSSDMPSSANGWATNFAYNHLPDEKYQLFLKFGDEDYLKTYGLQLIAGKNFTAGDTLKDVLINETLVKKLGLKNAEEAIGKPIRLGGSNRNTIAGVVKDFKTTSLREETRPLLIGIRKKSYNTTSVKLHTGNLTAAQNEIQKIWNSTFPEYAYNATFFDDSINKFYDQEQQLSLLYKIFAGLAIFISCLGLYGLVSFMAAQKTKEVGIRKVLGASIANIVYMFSKEFTLLIIISFLIAAPVSFYFTDSWLKNFAYHINIGGWIFMCSISVSIVVAWLTVGYKAIRAAIANPVKSLRTE